jgi:Zn-dependent protease with chaperone function
VFDAAPAPASTVPGLAASPLIAAEYFDGRSARAHAVQLRLSDGRLSITGDGITLNLPARSVLWPERTRHGARVAQLPNGGSLQCSDAQAWDAWALASGQAESMVVHAQQSWRWVLASVAALVVLAAALYLWGVPWLGRVVVAATPPSVDRAIGESALKALDEQWLKPSALPADQQKRLQQALARAVAAMPPSSVPAHRLEFRSGRIGPNAFALPGGTLVLTDALVELVQGDEAVITGVLGHELGHVLHRHGLRLLVQAGAIAALSSVVLGDFSTLLAGAPALLGQASYSRDAEREADAHAVLVLKAAGLSPAVMITFFEKVAARGAPNLPDKPNNSDKPADGASTKARSGLGIAIASHPADEERIRFFREAAGR